MCFFVIAVGRLLKMKYTFKNIICRSEAEFTRFLSAFVCSNVCVFVKCWRPRFVVTTFAWCGPMSDIVCKHDVLVYTVVCLKLAVVGS